MPPSGRRFENNLFIFHYFVPFPALSLQIYLLYLFTTGTSVVTVTATDADDQTYGNSAKLVYSILQGQPYFSVDSENGEKIQMLLCFFYKYLGAKPTN